MPNKQPSFNERCRAMHDAAEQLKDLAEIVALEAIHMDDAAKRFAERSETRTANSLEPAALPTSPV